MALFGKKKERTQADLSIETFKKILPKQSLDDLSKNLLPDERILQVISGLWDSAMILTPYRIFVFKAGMMGGATRGTKLISWDLNSVHGVQMEFGKATGYVSLQTPNAPVADLSYWSNDATSPAKAPNAIAINKKLEPQARTAVAELRQFLLKRSLPTT